MGTKAMLERHKFLVENFLKILKEEKVSFSEFEEVVADVEYVFKRKAVLT